MAVRSTLSLAVRKLARVHSEGEPSLEETSSDEASDSDKTGEDEDEDDDDDDEEEEEDDDDDDCEKGFGERRL